MDQAFQTEITDRLRTLALQNCLGNRTAYTDEFWEANGLNLPPTSDPETLQHLQMQRLKYVLRKQEEERNDLSFSRECLFCKKHFTQNRALLFEHLKIDHNLHIGSPDNIVFGNQLLDILSDMLEKLQCFFCEKTFKDWMVLKEHMRKKQHKFLNPTNKTYDKFYIINYLELGKNWTDVQKEQDYGSDSSQDEEFMECEEENSITCLLCPVALGNFEQILLHMKENHLFDYKLLKEKYQLEFYKQVKLINYIRHQINLKSCIYCGKVCDNNSELLNHMSTSKHILMLPDPSKWDVSMYYQPTRENDSFLCALDDDDNDDYSSCDETQVLPEEINIQSCLTEEEMRRCLL